jgi:tetratricopeptide (TPR) repeat protein
VAGSKEHQRRCQGCGIALARDNRSPRCGPCSRREVAREFQEAASAPVKPEDFWHGAALQDALAARHFGQVLYAYRHEHRPVLTQATVGRWLGLTQGQISRLERTPHPTHDLTKLDQWARALHIPQHCLWFRLSPDADAGQDASLGNESGIGHEDVRRRHLVLRALNVGTASLGDSTFGWFSAQPPPPPPSSSASPAVGMTDVRMIREMTQTFRKLDNRFGGAHARSALTTYLACEALPLVHTGRYRSDVHHELFTAVAELFQLAGWMAYDVGEATSGCRYLRQAIRLCQDVGDEALMGEMLAGMSHQAARFGSPALAIDLARAGKDQGKKAGLPALVAESAVMEAHGLALAHDVSGYLTALRESERAFATTQNRDRPPWLVYFDTAYLAGKFGRCFRDLGRPVEAERFARRSLEMTDGYDRVKLFNLVLLAAALADQRKVEEACEIGRQALCIAPDVRSVRTTADLADLARRLTPFHAEPAVQMLKEQMTTTGVLIQPR